MAMQFLENSQTVTTTEHSMPADATYAIGSPQTTLGVVQAFVDLNALVAGDQFRIRLYEKAATADTQRLAEEWILDGAQSKPLWTSPALLLARGWDWTILKLAGTDRLISWSIRRLPDV